MNVGPEFLHQVGDAVPHVQGAERAQVPALGAMFRGMVNIRQSRYRCVAQRFGIVEAAAAGIGASHEQTAQCVERTMRNRVPTDSSEGWLDRWRPGANERKGEIVKHPSCSELVFLAD